MREKVSSRLPYLYRMMFRSRYFETAVAKLWREGKITGEMHLSMGEEAICAGINDHLVEGDALALDHRGTAPLLMRGVDPVSLLKEFLGKPEGLCRGQGGHMHLFAPALLAASSGIVGAAGPAAAGFALAARYLRPGKLAVAYFGEGAVNQGMLMESLNLAMVWKLPVLFVCKDNNWSITTESDKVTGGNIVDRALAFGMPAEQTDGTSVAAVWESAGRMIDAIRRRSEPGFVLASCIHLEGHFLGDPMIDLKRRPVKNIRQMGAGLLRSLLHTSGGSVRKRAAAINTLGSAIAEHMRGGTADTKDPVKLLRKELAVSGGRQVDLENEIKTEIDEAVSEATA